MKEKQFNTWQVLLFYFAGILLSAIATYSVTTDYNNQLKDFKLPKIESNIDSLPELTLDNVLIELVKQEVRQPIIVLKQVVLETMWLKCKDCSLDVNNLFGFTSNKMLQFKNWKESIIFYKKWQSKYISGDYFVFLQRYWGAPNMEKYCEKLKQICL